MSYLAHVKDLPSAEHLTDEERKTLDKRFDANEFELNFDGEALEWGLIEEVEIVVAAREKSPSGWLLRNVVFRGERYHIGVYYGKAEVVLTNITLEVARFVAQTIAYYTRQDVRYTGVEGVAPVSG